MSAFGQTAVSCTAASTATLVRQEGLAEPVGDLTLTCTGGIAGSAFSSTLFVNLNTNITNRLDTNGRPFGITVTANSAPTGTVSLISATTLSVSGLNYAIPALPATPVAIKIPGIRAAVAPLSNGSAPAVVSATLAGTGAQFLNSASVTLALSAPTLLQSSLNNGVPCLGSPLPTTSDFAGFAAASISSTVRVTEASIGAFSAKKAGDDSGVRILVNLAGHRTGSRVFAPDAIVGNNGSTATSSGAFGVNANAGTYTPGTGQLLLARVNGADANGVGGTLAIQQPAAATTLRLFLKSPLQPAPRLLFTKLWIAIQPLWNLSKSPSFFL